MGFIEIGRVNVGLQGGDVGRGEVQCGRIVGEAGEVSAERRGKGGRQNRS